MGKPGGLSSMGSHRVGHDWSDLAAAAAAGSVSISCSVVSDSVLPHRQQPTRLPCPWDSPSKNTGVGCHFLLQCVKVKSPSRGWLLATPWTAAYQAPPSMGFSRQKYWSGVPLPSPTGGKQEVLFLAPFYRQGSRGSVRLNLQLASQTWHSRLIPLIWSCAMSGKPVWDGPALLKLFGLRIPL